MESIVVLYWSSYPRTKVITGLFIMYRDQLKFFDLEQIIDHRPGPSWWWNYPDNFHWSSHLSWRYSSSTSNARNYIRCGQGTKGIWIDRCIVMDRRILGTECMSRFNCIPVPWSVEYKLLWLNSAIDHRPGPRDGKNYPDSFHWSSTSVLEDILSVHRCNYLLRSGVQVSMNRSVYSNWSSYPLGRECILGLGLYVISWIQVLWFDSYRSPSESSDVVDSQDRFHLSSVYLKIFVSTSGAIICCG